MVSKILKRSLWVLFVLGFYFQGFAGNVAPQVGKEMPKFLLPLPKSKIERKYLGVSDKKNNFTISDIKSDVVIVEIFSMYCPHCQRHAPTVNKLYDEIQKDPELKKRIKIVGIGIGNSQYEVDFFRKKYKIQFPLIPDGEFKIYKEIGVKRTPYFIAVKRDKDGKSVVFYSKPGGFDDHKEFLKNIVKLSGIKTEK